VSSLKISALVPSLILGEALSLFFANAAMAQDFPQPTTAHRILAKDVGTWDAQVKVWPIPGAEPFVSKGVETNELLRGGMWLVSRFEGEYFGAPFTGVGTFGYDPAEKRYVGTWIDTISPYPMITKSNYDPKSQTMTGTSEVREPQNGEKYSASMTTRYSDDGSRVMEMRRQSKDGQEWKMMEIFYKRRPQTKEE